MVGFLEAIPVQNSTRLWQECGVANGRSGNKPVPPLNEEKLRALALHYVGKYATTKARLGTYLTRKIRERGWDGERHTDVAALVEQFAELGYIDDAQFAEARSRSFVRRGYGERRLDEDLRAGGIGHADAVAAKEHMSESSFAAAENFARRKRIGPFASTSASPEKRQKQLQAFLRAGHGFALSKRFVEADVGDELAED
ncbi:MAG: regulatory protein RecX [Sphingomonadaceae bacterium]|nr:regulatory protein RecX [Sphingomonadaceae bacterium]